MEFKIQEKKIEEIENKSQLLSLFKKREQNEWLLSCGWKTRANGLYADTADMPPSKSFLHSSWS